MAFSLSFPLSRATWPVAGRTLSSFCLLGSMGCEDLGPCDEAKARTLILNAEGQALYAGQAVMNRACAAGQCHASEAEGVQRRGVPKGLDFDLTPAPVVAAGADGGIASGALQVDGEALSMLRRNQRRISDLREDIWGQIADGLMPPDGVGAAFRQAEPGYGLTITGDTCRRGKDAIAPISDPSTWQIVRNWLACRAPVVEVSHAAIPVSTLAQQPAGQPGTVGRQVPFCRDCNAPITFEELHASVFQTCVAGCHTSGGIAEPDDYDGLDLTNIATAYASLTRSGARGGSEDCNLQPSPLIVPGDPAASYLVVKMGGTGSGSHRLCGLTMPLGQPVLECGLQQVIRWIEDGAPGPRPAVEGAGAGR